jgi:hypothetical protein
MPTILNYLNYDSDYIAFGNDLFDDSRESFAFNTNGSSYHFYMRDHILEMMDNRPLGLYNFRKDKYLEINLIGEEPELVNIMTGKMRAVIQSYNSRLIDNDMVVRKH